MSYLALYRKYRPSCFNEMVGQNEVIEVIKMEIINNRISHAYLFAGSRGTGKTTTAKIIARMVNCEHLNDDGSPCGKCDFCKNFNASNDIVEIDAASNNGVDEIRELRDKVNLVPGNAKYKVYIIDEVHMLTTQAFNALLKTLEEPPSHIIFILATTEYHKIPVTVISRCQKFQFSKITNDEIVSRLKSISKNEEIDVDDDCLFEIARLSDGGMRDAINMLDQLSAYSNNKIVLDDVYKLNGTFSYDDLYKLIDYIFSNKFDMIINFVDDINKNGKNISKFLEEFLTYIRDVIYYKSTGCFYNLKSDNIKNIADNYSINLLYDIMLGVNKIILDIKNSYVPYILLGVSLIDLSNKLNTFVNENINVKIESNLSNKDIIKQENYVTLSKNDVVNVKNVNNINVIDEKTRRIRINNTFYSASKDNKNIMLDNFNKLDGLLLDSEYGNASGLLKDTEVMVVGDNYMILIAKYDSLVERLYNSIIDIEKLIYHISNVKYKVVFLAKDEWKFEFETYIKNKNDRYKYKFIEDNEDLIDNNDKSDVYIITNILGNDIIEYV